MDREESLWENVSCWLWYHVEFHRDRWGELFSYFDCLLCTETNIYNTIMSKSLLLICYIKFKSRNWKHKSRHLTEPKLKVQDYCYVFSAYWALTWFLVAAQSSTWSAQSFTWSTDLNSIVHNMLVSAIANFEIYFVFISAILFRTIRNL
jgi:hypothetical protein